MVRHRASSYRRVCLRSIAGGLLIFAAACSEGAGPSSESAPADDPTLATPSDTGVTTPADTVVTPVPGDSGATTDSSITGSTDSAGGVPITDAASVAPGIVFGTMDMLPAQLTSVHTGTLLGGPLDPTNIISMLSQTRAKGGRIVVKLSKGKDSYVKNADGTFSLTKWKALVGRYQSVDLAPYIADGTIIGHYLIDEPHMVNRWGPNGISPATLEAMAQYSKQLWPTMTTFVRVVPSWLAAAPVTYKYLDAGWLQYAANKGSLSPLLATEVAAARSKGLGLMVGLNVFGGGDGSSRIPYPGGKWAMSASEITNYGTTLLNQTYACGFYMWVWDSGYYGRSDIKSAMTGLSTKAKAHVKTSCKQ